MLPLQKLSAAPEVIPSRNEGEGYSSPEGDGHEVVFWLGEGVEEAAEPVVVIYLLEADVDEAGDDEGELEGGFPFA